MIVIGADTHKNTHALAAVDANTGQLRGEREIPARDVGHLEALRWAHELDGEIVWAIEDCRDLSYHLEQSTPGHRRARRKGRAEADGRLPPRRTRAREV